MKSRSYNWLFASLSLLLAMVTAPAARASEPGADSGAGGLTDGAGIWANLWNYPPPDESEAYCLTLKEHGIRNLYIQTSRSNTAAITQPEKLGSLIETCHRHGIRVIAWSFAELLNPEADADKMVQAAQFTSANGEHIDGIAPNLEKNLEGWRIEKYSKAIRAKLGRNYPMLAVVYSPLNRCFEVARIPWPVLAKYYDGIAPMIYWNSKYQKIEPYSYTVETVQKIRQLTGRPDIEIHAIGDGMGSKPEAIKEFLRACRTVEATGVSLYPNQKATAEQLKSLSGYVDYLPANGRYRLAAFRGFVAERLLPEPAGKDPSIAVSRRDFYRLVVGRLHPALAAGHELKSRHPALRRLPSPVECKEAGPVEAYGILVGLGLVKDLTDSCSIESVLDAPVVASEAMSLLSAVVELDRKRDIIERGHKGKPRLDRWFVPSAQAESLPSGASSSVRLNYLDVSQMVLQTASALR